MGHVPVIYGLDIETDISQDGLDPAIASVRAVALSGRTFDELYVGDEADLLRSLDDRLTGLPQGVVATWNGSAFDLPFLADRARILGVPLGLKLRLDRAITMHRAPLPGHGGAYRASWHDHGHLDTFRLYGDETATAGQRLSLRSIARFVGIGHHEVRTGRTQTLSNEALHACAPSDARLARVLAERRWPGAARMIDHVDWNEAEHVAVAAARIARREVRPAIGPAIATY